MKATPSLLAAAGVLLGLTGTPALAQDGGRCFYTSEIVDSHRVGPREIDIRTRDNRYFRVTTQNDCRTGAANDPLIFNTGGSSGRICRPVDVSLSSGLHPNTPCLVGGITRITPEEASARARAR